MQRTETDLTRCDADFSEATTLCRCVPTRFYFNLTERCNLRCQHCITRAPELTRSGRARDLSREVLDAIRPHLGAAAYMGFPHAGEPLLAPMLEPTLVALQDARAGAATQVHVLTNTLALSLERFIHLVELGVSSWSFSVDGMSAFSNDWLRQGAKVKRSLQLVHQCSEWRQHNSVDVRMGIACTVHQRNLSELDAMVNFVHDAGLDWLKLEEMYPVNSLSHELATMDAEQLRTALATAAELATTLGIKLLFHIDELDARRCLCDDNPRVQQFCELDSFANRMDIHACRLPWELVCIEPNGDVKPLSFHHPVAGNILKQDLMHIWNSPGFVSVRQQVNARCVHQLHQRNCTAAAPGPQHW